MPSAAFSRSSNNPSPMARRHEVRAVDLHTFRVPQKAGDEASRQPQHFFLKPGTVEGDSPVHWQTIAYLLYIFQGYLVGSRAKYQKARRDPSPYPVAVEWASLSLTIVRIFANIAEWAIQSSISTSGCGLRSNHGPWIWSLITPES